MPNNTYAKIHADTDFTIYSNNFFEMKLEKNSNFGAPVELSYTDIVLNLNNNLSVYAGDKQYELVDHLQNVHVIVSDRKLAIDDGTYSSGVKINSTPDGIIDYFEPDVLVSRDFYPGGMQMPNRSFSSDSYRYGFNGKEKDGEVSGEGNSYDYGFRIYNPRLGRFLSVDPLMRTYPMLTPYQFASNTPISSVDIDGLEAKCVVNEQGKLTEAAIEVLKDISPGGAELLSKIVFKVNDSYVPEGMGAITLGTTVYLTKKYSEYLETRTGKTLEMVSHEGKHVYDVSTQGVLGFYLNYAMESAEAYINAGFSTTNSEGNHIHDDLPAEASANKVEKVAEDYVKSNPNIIDVLESEMSSSDKVNIVRASKANSNNGSTTTTSPKGATTPNNKFESKKSSNSSSSKQSTPPKRSSGKVSVF